MPNAVAVAPSSTDLLRTRADDFLAAIAGWAPQGSTLEEAEIAAMLEAHALTPDATPVTDGGRYPAGEPAPGECSIRPPQCWITVCIFTGFED